MISGMFETTRWSLIAAVGSGDSAACRAALAALCETYWYSLYAYVRRRGANPDDARDLTQGFLTSLLDRRHFENLREDRGRFRAFLLASFQNFLAKEHARHGARKRGGDVTILSLSFEDAEGRYRFEPAEPATPETLYARRWALTVIDGVLGRLRQDWESKQRAVEFDALKAFLLGEAPAGGYAAIAENLGLSETAVRVSVHRLKRRFQAQLKRAIAETVSDPADIDDEIRYLIRALDA
jgi:RNA polymerase sigma-70 factor (ECF subfamily)